jgi:hypothetical protein
MQNTHPAKPSPAKAHKLFGLSEVRPGEAATRSVPKLRLCQSENNAEDKQEGRGEGVKDADCN